MVTVTLAAVRTWSDTNLTPRPLPFPVKLSPPGHLEAAPSVGTDST